MMESPKDYLNNRVIKINVGFLLNGGPARSHDSELDIPAVCVSDDLKLSYLKGKLRLSRVKEGILVQAQFETALDDECCRCLSHIQHTTTLDLEELYSYHSKAETEFSINQDGILDLSPLLREEVLIATNDRALCKEDCQGLCPSCGINLNNSTCNCSMDNIDPRLEELKKLLDAN